MLAQKLSTVPSLMFPRYLYSSFLVLCKTFWCSFLYVLLWRENFCLLSYGQDLARRCCFCFSKTIGISSLHLMLCLLKTVLPFFYFKRFSLFTSDSIKISPRIFWISSWILFFHFRCSGLLCPLFLGFMPKVSQTAEVVA